jgi:hypothetical protein
VNPRHVHRQDNACGADGFAEAHTLGVELSQAVAAELGAAQELNGPLEVLRSERLELPRGETLLTALMGANLEAAELLEWSLAGARLVSVPGEAFQAFGRAVHDARSGPVLIAGLAPTWLGYLPVPFGEGYEESMSLGAPFVDALLAALLSPPAARAETG